MCAGELHNNLRMKWWVISFTSPNARIYFFSEIILITFVRGFRFGRSECMICAVTSMTGVHACRGKAVLPWTPTPDEAIAATCHLNHKYALDGCDPCSYGGILWCYGLFDKPMGTPS